MTSQTTIFVVDDDDGVRDLLRALLEFENYLVKDYASAKAFLQEYSLSSIGCLIADIRMPEMDGLELQNELVTRGAGLPVIVVTGHGDIPLAVRAMRAGAVDFIEKPYADEHLLASVRRSLQLGRERRDEFSFAQRATEKIENLTPRERDVLDELVLGHPNKVIAHHLSISPRTVEIYRANLMEKMEARSLSELVRAAISAETLKKQT